MQNFLHVHSLGGCRYCGLSSTITPRYLTLSLKTWIVSFRAKPGVHGLTYRVENYISWVLVGLSKRYKSLHSTYMLYMDLHWVMFLYLLHTVISSHFVAGFGSVGTIIEGPIIAWVSNAYGWSQMFPMMVILSLLGAGATVKASWSLDTSKEG